MSKKRVVMYGRKRGEFVGNISFKKHIKFLKLVFLIIAQ
jgi:hypothetical protein